MYFPVNSMKFFSTAFLAATVHVNLWFSKKMIKSMSAIVYTSTLRIHSSLCFVSCCAAWQMYRCLKYYWIECPFKNNQTLKYLSNYGYCFPGLLTVPVNSTSLNFNRKEKCVRQVVYVRIDLLYAEYNLWLKAFAEHDP